MLSDYSENLVIILMPCRGHTFAWHRWPCPLMMLPLPLAHSAMILQLPPLCLFFFKSSLSAYFSTSSLPAYFSTSSLSAYFSKSSSAYSSKFSFCPHSKPTSPDFLNPLSPPAYLNFLNPTSSIPAILIESAVSLEELVTSFEECSDAESIPRIPPIVADQLQVYVRLLPPLLSVNVMEVLTDFQYPKKKFMTSKINKSLWDCWKFYLGRKSWDKAR